MPQHRVARQRAEEMDQHPELLVRLFLVRVTTQRLGGQRGYEDTPSEPVGQALRKEHKIFNFFQTCLRAWTFQHHESIGPTDEKMRSTFFAHINLLSQKTSNSIHSQALDH